MAGCNRMKSRPRHVRVAAEVDAAYLERCPYVLEYEERYREMGRGQGSAQQSGVQTATSVRVSPETRKVASNSGQCREIIRVLPGASAQSQRPRQSGRKLRPEWRCHPAEGRAVACRRVSRSPFPRGADWASKRARAKGNAAAIASGHEEDAGVRAGVGPGRNAASRQHEKCRKRNGEEACQWNIVGRASEVSNEYECAANRVAADGVTSC